MPHHSDACGFRSVDTSSTVFVANEDWAPRPGCSCLSQLHRPCSFSYNSWSCLNGMRLIILRSSVGALPLLRPGQHLPWPPPSNGKASLSKLAHWKCAVLILMSVFCLLSWGSKEPLQVLLTSNEGLYTSLPFFFFIALCDRNLPVNGKW